MWVRFLSRGFHDGSIIEAGEVIDIADDTVLGRHMVIVTAETPDSDQPRFATRFQAVPDSVAARAQLTEEFRQRAEATRLREAEAERLRVAASLLPQPAVEAVPAEIVSTDQGGVAADG